MGLTCFNKRKDKDVRFDLYCPICKYRDNKLAKDRCNKCLAKPHSTDGIRPTEWKTKG